MVDRILIKWNGDEYDWTRIDHLKEKWMVDYLASEAEYMVKESDVRAQSEIYSESGKKLDEIYDEFWGIGFTRLEKKYTINELLDIFDFELYEQIEEDTAEFRHYLRHVCGVVE